MALVIIMKSARPREWGVNIDAPWKLVWQVYSAGIWETTGSAGHLRFLQSNAVFCALPLLRVDFTTGRLTAVFLLAILSLPNPTTRKRRSQGSAKETMPRRPRIAVVGSANIDLTTFTDQFPKPGETIFGQKFDLGFGGKGANQAVAARLCGADVFMVARVGDDLFGPATIKNFEKLGIDATHVRQVSGVSSGVAPIFVESSGQNRIIVVKGANDALKPADVDAAADTLKRADCIVLQFEIPLDTVYYTIQFARKNGIRCILNPAPAQPIDLKAVAGLDYFVPNESEASTGAGDAFIGSFATFLGEGWPELEAARRANLYAGLSTMGVGTQKSFYDRARFEGEWAARQRT